MEVEVSYKAKDGRYFDDPYECEKYEKMLGVKRGSIGELVKELEDTEGYVMGLVVCRHDGKNCTSTFITRCIDDYLEDYVNVENLSEYKRYLRCSTKECIESLSSSYNKDDMCQFMLLIGDIDFNTYNIRSSYNGEMWREIEESKKK